jgi:hypothetical protein
MCRVVKENVLAPMDDLLFVNFRVQQMFSKMRLEVRLE